MKKEAGITLIALVITIIVLLILAAVTINLTLGERGIFSTAQKAGKNYKEASEKELADLTNLEKEMQNVINGTGNGGSTKPETKPVKLNTVTKANYGEYVKYPVSIGHGPDENAHKSDWRIFYNDGTYVYLIASYLLLNSQAPEGIGTIGIEEYPYTTYWADETSVPAYKEISNVAKNQYKMNYNVTGKTDNFNIKVVSTLLDTSKWTKFVNSTYAEDAIGAPTLEMWVESWNQIEETKLYYNNSGDNGYYIGTTSNPTTTMVTSLDMTDILFWPVRNDENAHRYWIASPSADDSAGTTSVVGASEQRLYWCKRL